MISPEKDHVHLTCSFFFPSDLMSWPNIRLKDHVHLTFVGTMCK